MGRNDRVAVIKVLTEWRSLIFKLIYPTNTSIRQYLYVCNSIRLSFDELIHWGAFNDIRKDAFELG